MTIQEAITKAVAGGFKKEESDWTYYAFALSPLFWQALFGDKWVCGKHGYQEPDGATACDAPSDSGESFCGRPLRMQFLLHWHYFIDHLAEGKSIESYFEKL